MTRLGRAGAVAIVTAVCAPLLCTIVGFVVDFGYASYINQRLARAADDATLGSVSQTAATAGGGYGNLSYLQSTGVNYFNANTAQLGITGATFSLSVTSDGTGGVVAQGSYSYKAPTFFAQILGFPNIPVSGNATTVARPLTYINYYILVDTSQSMGIGATQADMAALYQRVADNKNAASSDIGCVFGCHVPGRVGVDSNGKDIMQKFSNEELAHDPKHGSYIELRIDSAVLAVTSIISSAAQYASTNKNIKFGLYTLNEDPTTGKRVQFVQDPPSSDYAASQAAAAKIDLGNTVGNANNGDSDFKNEINDFLSGLSPKMAQGTGVSETSPLNYIFLVTDGLNDVDGNCAYNICTSAFDAQICNSLKINATVGVIYTTYLPVYQFNTPPNLETRYSTLVNGLPPTSQTNLQKCASSPNLYFEAQDGPGIVASMQTLFQRTQPVSARISQ